MKELDYTIKELQNIKKICNLNVDDNTILEQSVKIYLSNMIRESKEKNIQMISGEKKGMGSMNANVDSLIMQKPTDKQIAFLKKSNYQGIMPKTKEAAKQLISKYLEGKKDDY